MNGWIKVDIAEVWSLAAGENKVVSICDRVWRREKARGSVGKYLYAYVAKM
jgi:hypothetical protein